MTDQVLLGMLFVLGLFAGGWVNWAIFRWNSQKLCCTPWGPVPPAASPRGWADCLPILGWIRLRREASLHGAGFWVRPIVIELLTGLGFAGLYWFEVLNFGLMPKDLPESLYASHGDLVTTYVSHVLLMCLMLVASFIDLDEQLIPDQVTFTGTLLGLLLVTCFPQILLPIPIYDGPDPSALARLVWTTSSSDPGWLDGLGGPQSWPPRLNDDRGLVVGLLCWAGWCVAVHPTAYWNTSRGWMTAIRLRWVSMFHNQRWKFMAWFLPSGSVLITIVWWISGPSWQALLTGLIGMAGSGAIVWAIRIVGQMALGQEAMGFGDVTLMGMIGPFVGWQCGLIIFFMSPFAAMAIVLIQFVLTRERHIAFGPYLCLATMFLICGWPAIWERTGLTFYPLYLVPGIFLFMLLILGGLLSLLNIVKSATYGREA